MKNIWKLLMVAMMAIAMVGCPQPKDDDNGGGEESGPTFTSFTGVYSFDASVDSLSAAWGGSPASPSFSIMLMDEIAIDSIAAGTVTDLKQMPVGSPVYQLQGLGNASFLTAIDGSWKTKYDGLAATVANGSYTVFVDGSKITKTQLKGIGMDFGTEGEQAMTANDSVDLTGYVPVVLALSDNTTDEPYKSAYIADLWNGRLHKMTAGATYPNAQDTPDLVKFSVKFTGTSHIDSADASLKGDQTISWTVTDVEYYEGAKVPFNFFADNSGTTAEVAAADATLTATLTAGQYDWEAAEAPADYKGYKIAKKCNLGTASDIWLGFDALTATYKIGDTKAAGSSTDPVNAATPTFTTNLSTETVTYAVDAADVTALTVVAAVTDDGTLSYQWQKKAESDENFTDIDGATEASYTPAVTAAGTTQYKVIVTNTNNDATGEKTATAASAIATVTVE